MEITDKQVETMKENLEYIILSALDDGDILVYSGITFGVYVLTKNGKVQTVQYHYKFLHRVIP